MRREDYRVKNYFKTLLLFFDVMLRIFIRRYRHVKRIFHFVIRN